MSSSNEYISRVLSDDHEVKRERVDDESKEAEFKREIQARVANVFTTLKNMFNTMKFSKEQSTKVSKELDKLWSAIDVMGILFWYEENGSARFVKDLPKADYYFNSELVKHPTTGVLIDTGSLAIYAALEQLEPHVQTAKDVIAHTNEIRRLMRSLYNWIGATNTEWSYERMVAEETEKAQNKNAEDEYAKTLRRLYDAKRKAEAKGLSQEVDALWKEIDALKAAEKERKWHREQELQRKSNRIF